MHMPFALTPLASDYSLDPRRRASTRLRASSVPVQPARRGLARLRLLRLRWHVPEARTTRPRTLDRSASASASSHPGHRRLLARRGHAGAPGDLRLRSDAIDGRRRRRRAAWRTRGTTPGQRIARAWRIHFIRDPRRRTRSSRTSPTCTSRSSPGRRPARPWRSSRAGQPRAPGGRSAGSSGSPRSRRDARLSSDAARARAGVTARRDRRGAPEARAVRRCARGLPRRARPPRPDLRRPRAARRGPRSRRLLLAELGEAARQSPPERMPSGARRAGGTRPTRSPTAPARALADDPDDAGQVRATCSAIAREIGPPDRGPQLLDRPDGAGAPPDAGVSESAGGSSASGAISNAPATSCSSHRDEVAEPPAAPAIAAQDSSPSGAPSTPGSGRRQAAARRSAAIRGSADAADEPLRRRPRSSRRRRRAPRHRRLGGHRARAGAGRPRRRTTSGAIQPGDIIVCPSSNPSWVPRLRDRRRPRHEHRRRAVARGRRGPRVRPAGGRRRRATPRRGSPTGGLVEIDGTAGTVRLL